MQILINFLYILYLDYWFNFILGSNILKINICAAHEKKNKRSCNIVFFKITFFLLLRLLISEGEDLMRKFLTGFFLKTIFLLFCYMNWDVSAETILCQAYIWKLLECGNLSPWLKSKKSWIPPQNKVSFMIAYSSLMLFLEPSLGTQRTQKYTIHEYRSDKRLMHGFSENIFVNKRGRGTLYSHRKWILICCQQ